LAADSIRLPGEAAQLRMAPLARGEFPKDQNILASASRSAVLVLLYPWDQSAHTVLIKRKAYEGVHSAQVSFPGGKHEDTDSDFAMTALREAQEEVGVDAGVIKVICRLSQLYIPPSGFLVYPFLATTEERPAFKPDPKEVESIIELNLSDLLQDRLVKSKQMTLGSGLTTSIPYFDFHGHIVWGATAMILSELKELLRRLLATQ
jgi:8-oxo-dGTP pyrophosphatase MutT (NUDIX family)